MTTVDLVLSAEEMLRGRPFVSYTYAYPHKTAYRVLGPGIPLSRVWREERRDSLFLYLHLPFCEHRCGFCNLFTLAQPAADLAARYLSTLRREAEAVRAALGSAAFSRLAIGGGTPTFLSLQQLEQAFAIVAQVMGADPRLIPASCEASPATVDLEKLLWLRERGVDRISLGVQSFDERDARDMGRPQQREDVLRALEWIRSARFPRLNIDLIYGGERQSMDSWLETVAEAVHWRPEELYLYPLYVRPLTGLGRATRHWDDWRLDAYRQARDYLLSRDYQQISLRMFRKSDGAGENGAGEEGLLYCCQTDGMIGLGCGARSYTRELHYSTPYAVRAPAIKEVLQRYLSASDESFATADYGFQLDLEDQRRRFVLMSILQQCGLEREAYRRRFGADVLCHLPELRQLQTLRLAEITGPRIQLTAAGLERSDAIGPWFYSRKVRERMEAYAWR